jgi:hypothetical protein
MEIIRESNPSETNRVQPKAHPAPNVNAPTMDRVVWGLTYVVDVDNLVTLYVIAQNKEEVLHHYRQGITADHPFKPRYMPPHT